MSKITFQTRYPDGAIEVPGALHLSDEIDFRAANPLASTSGIKYKLPLNRKVLPRILSSYQKLLNQVDAASALTLQEVNPSIKTAATLTTALTGSNNDLVFTAPAGAAGNATTVAYVNPATPSAALSVVVAGKAVTVNLATDAGTAQVTTATANGTLSGTSGTVAVVVTGAGITGSPITIQVATTSGDTASVWAGKVRTALGLNAAITALYTVGGTTTAIKLTRIVPAANDGTLNISLDNGTSTGVVTASSSAATTAGVAPAITSTAASIATLINGVAQISTASAVGTITLAGNVQVTVTGGLISIFTAANGFQQAYYSNSIVVNVPVALSDANTAWASKVVTALQAVGAITQHYNVTGGSGTIILTAINPAANDTALNIALANGTTTGVTAAPTSTATQAGVAPATTLVTAANASANDGTGVVTALTATALTGGLDWTVVQTLVSAVSNTKTTTTAASTSRQDYSMASIAPLNLTGGNELWLSFTGATANGGHSADYLDLQDIVFEGIVF